MQQQRIDYRVTLLTAAKLRGATQESPAFQLVVPNALRDLAAGRHRLEFVNQAQSAFIRTNRSEWLAELKTDAGTAKAAGVELTLLDCARWFHEAGGISAVAQIARDLGKKALPRRLPALAGHEAQAKALDPFGEDARSVKLLDPTPAIEAGEMSGRWKIQVNWPK